MCVCVCVCVYVCVGRGAGGSKLYRYVFAMILHEIGIPSSNCQEMWISQDLLIPSRILHQIRIPSIIHVSQDTGIYVHSSLV